MLSSSSFTAQEVYFAELVNRARSDPQAEAARLGFDLTEGLSAGQLSMFGPAEPLALDLSLTLASRAHSLDMATRGFFDHVNPDGRNPTHRAQAAGYPGVAGETIGLGHNSIDALYEAWMYTPENRANLLSLITSFDEGFHYDQIGPGFANDLGFADDHFAALFGDPGAGSSARLLGVVYDDIDSDDFYSIGEGLGGVTIEVAEAANPDAVVATFTTDDAGNYQIKLGDGSWIITFTNLATGWGVVRTVVTSGENAKLDARAGEFQAPDDGGGSGDGGSGDGGSGDGGSGDGGSGDGGSGDGGSGDGGDDGGSGDGGSQDDHANDGDYASATLVTLDANHTAEDTGEVGVGADTDLFYFTADTAGGLTVTLDASGGGLVGMLTLQSDAGLNLAVEHAGAAGQRITLDWNVVAGRQYFIVVGAYAGDSAGAYTLGIAIGDPDDGGSGDGGGDGGSGDGDGDGGGDGGSGDGSGDGGSGDGGGDGGSGDDGSGDGGQDPADDDPPVDASSDDSGGFTIVRRDDSGNPIVYTQEPDGSWTSVDLIAQAGGPTPEGRFSTFVDPETGLVSVVSATGAGLAIYSRDTDGHWIVRNLSAELDAPPIESKPVTFATRSGLVYTAGLDAEGNLIAYHHTGEADESGGFAWGFVDITSGDLASQGVAMPGLSGGTLIAYVTGWNALTIAGLDQQGNIYAAWWAPGQERWALANLSGITGAPKYEGTISAYLTPWKGINIAGTDENGDLSVVWWVPTFGGTWKVSKLNEILGGPRLGEGTIASWVTPWGGLNVSGLTADGKVVVYWWTPSSGGWKIATLSDSIRDVDPPVRGVIGRTSQTGVISILGLSEAGDLVRYWWQAGQPWSGEALPAG